MFVVFLLKNFQNLNSNCFVGIIPIIERKIFHFKLYILMFTIKFLKSMSISIKLSFNLLNELHNYKVLIQTIIDFYVDIG
jgi:hypothetical protein